MSVIEIIVFLTGGLVMLFLGAEGLIRGSSNLAIKIGITPLVVGLTVVAFGTGSPELFVSLKAALNGNSAIALGNVIGSNIANIALILGVASLIRPIEINSRAIKREIPLMIAFTILLPLLFLIDGELNLMDGIIFLTALVVFIVVNIKLAKVETHKAVKTDFEKELKSRIKIPISIIFILIGLTLLAAGANIFLQGAVALAKLFKMSDVVIGLTIVAIGTSLPELITCIVASHKKASDILLGNVVGSNIFNILGILGLTAVIIPISAVGLSFIDFGIMIFSSIIILPLSKTGHAITRIEGAFLFTGYILYMYYLLPK